MSHDRRAHARASINMEVLLSGGHLFEHPMWLRNVSASGAYVQMGDIPAPLPALGSEVKLIISDDSGGNLVAEEHWARVMRVNADGIGVMFLSAIDTDIEEEATHRRIA